MGALKDLFDVAFGLVQKAPSGLPPPKDIPILQEDGADPTAGDADPAGGDADPAGGDAVPAGGVADPAAESGLVNADSSAEAKALGVITVSWGDDAAAGTVPRGAEGLPDIEQGLQEPLHLPPPEEIEEVEEGIPTREKEEIEEVKEGGPTWVEIILYHIPARLEWFFKSRMLSCPGDVHGPADPPDNHVITIVHICIMQETMMPLWIRNLFLRNGWTEDDFWQWLLKHDSVAVKIGDKEWIKAEKGGQSRPLENDGGIKLKRILSSVHPKDLRDPGDAAPGRYKIRIELKVNGNVEFTWKQLKQLLTSSSLWDYNVFTANCWHYAYSIAEAFFQGMSSEDERVQKEIDQNLGKLKPLERSWKQMLTRLIMLLTFSSRVE